MIFKIRNNLFNKKVNAMLKKKFHNWSMRLTYHFSCLHPQEHSLKCFRSQYKLLEEIGRGGFGIVYKAVRLSDGSPVAVKYILHQHVRDWKIVDRQMIPSEAAHLQAVCGMPGIIRIIDWFANSKGFLIVMERPENCMDLFDVISGYGRLDEPMARLIFKQVIEATYQLFTKHSLVHRDIKDENLILDMDSGEIKMVDFGAADYLESAKNKGFQGTKSYCPPEWFKKKLYLPMESTCWSLGVLLYLIVTGLLPFKNEIQICVGKITFPEGISKECQHLIRRLLCISPEGRADLKEVLNHAWMQMKVEKLKQPFQLELRRRSVKKRSRRRRGESVFDGVSDDDEDMECMHRRFKRSSEESVAKALDIPREVILAAEARRKSLQTGNIHSIRQKYKDDNKYFSNEILNKDKTNLPSYGTVSKQQIIIDSKDEGNKLSRMYTNSYYNGLSVEERRRTFKNKGRSKVDQLRSCPLSTETGDIITQSQDVFASADDQFPVSFPKNNPYRSFTSSTRSRERTILMDDKTHTSTLAKLNSSFETAIEDDANSVTLSSTFTFYSANEEQVDEPIYPQNERNFNKLSNVRNIFNCDNDIFNDKKESTGNLMTSSIHTNKYFPSTSSITSVSTTLMIRNNEFKNSVDCTSDSDYERDDLSFQSHEDDVYYSSGIVKGLSSRSLNKGLNKKNDKDRKYSMGNLQDYKVSLPNNSNFGNLINEKYVNKNEDKHSDDSKIYQRRFSSVTDYNNLKTSSNFLSPSPSKLSSSSGEVVKENAKKSLSYFTQDLSEMPCQSLLKLTNRRDESNIINNRQQTSHRYEREISPLRFPLAVFDVNQVLKKKENNSITADIY
ncbi:Serine/threonine-protein kinase pim-2 [Strongyloides ratti]|uniref:Serine/threonine-protein kinase 1 n=1 Tax=Strongyloides ratti TaxID=34506 RepID=A0A090L891_STRRB|nr:Serine/threonine-protein kinase pim-2 [Strongyloides ratti]CEF63680.1 Serine/threonine-protein kinase pim-2 [Strongyloides ratti]